MPVSEGKVKMLEITYCVPFSCWMEHPNIFGGAPNRFLFTRGRISLQKGNSWGCKLPGWITNSSWGDTRTQNQNLPVALRGFPFPLGILAHRTSDDEKGVESPKRNGKVFRFHYIPFLEGEPGSLGFGKRYRFLTTLFPVGGWNLAAVELAIISRGEHPKKRQKCRAVFRQRIIRKTHSKFLGLSSQGT